MTVNDRLIEDINAALPFAKDEDWRVLHYIKNTISATGLAKRPDEEQDVSHLREVAKTRLANVHIPKEDDEQ